MKTIFILVMVLMMITACTTAYGKVPEPTATTETLLNVPNPASLYCQQNGYQNEIRTAGDGSQSGFCVFSDGSECEEWAYFRGVCGPEPVKKPAELRTAIPTHRPGEGGAGGFIPPGTIEPIADWWGVIKSTGKGAQYDDYFERQDLGQVITFGIDSKIPDVQKKIVALRDSGIVVHLYGTLVSNVPDYNGSQILVDRLEEEKK